MRKFPVSRATLGMLILSYMLSLSVCSFDFDGGNKHSWDDHVFGLHCAGDLDNFTLSGHQNSSLVIMTFPLVGLSQIREPILPFLSFSIFRPPQIARIFLQG